jgi:hypothetical protein
MSRDEALACLHPQQHELDRLHAAPIGAEGQRNEHHQQDRHPGQRPEHV